MADTSPETTLRFAEATLDTIDHMDKLLGGSGQAAADKVAFADLYAYAIDPNHEPADQLLDALDRNTGLQADFQRLLRNTARYYMPEVAAASTGALESREVDGCRIIFKPSKADPDQLYVIVEATADKSFNPEILFVQFSDGRSRRAALAGAQNGRVQILLDRGSEIAQGLLDISTEVYVK